MPQSRATIRAVPSESCRLSWVLLLAGAVLFVAGCHQTARQEQVSFEAMSGGSSRVLARLTLSEVSPDLVVFAATLVTAGSADAVSVRDGACGASGRELGSFDLSDRGRGETRLAGRDLEGYRESSVVLLKGERPVACAEVPDRYPVHASNRPIVSVATTRFRR